MTKKGFLKSNVVKVLIIGIMIIAAVVYGIKTYKKYTGGIQPERQSAAERNVSQQPRGNPQQFRQQMMKELNLTSDQQKKIDELMASGRPQTREEFQERMKKFNEILTPEQQAKARASMQDRMQKRIQARLDRASKVLPPDQLEILKKRLEDRMKRFNNGFPPPPPPPDAPPPDAPPPIN